MRYLLFTLCLTFLSALAPSAWANNAQAAHMSALAYSFLWDKLSR